MARPRLSVEDLKDEVHNRLMQQHEPDLNTGCWIYTGCWDADGIGRISVACRKYTVPRVSAWLFKGLDLDSDVVVSHRRGVCDCAACFNPDHLVILPSQSACMRETMLAFFATTLPKRRRLAQAAAF